MNEILFISTEGYKCHDRNVNRTHWVHKGGGDQSSLGRRETKSGPPERHTHRCLLASREWREVRRQGSNSRERNSRKKDQYISK